MAVAHDASGGRSRVARILNTDFCPWANRFVYWLKEPVGWFVLAACVSCIVGMYFSPIGWSIAAALFGLVVIGMIWPLVAVRAAEVSLHPELRSVHEESSCSMWVSVRNRIPIPIWGLAVEGYLDRCHPEEEAGEEDDSQPLPTVALASVPAMSEVDYRIDVFPTLRGHYPRKIPMIACSFPFAIYTARRPLKRQQTLTVWPRVYQLSAMPAINGKARTDSGDGSRSGSHGDFIGLRDYRRGDSVKNINWVASAKADSLVVIERGAPQTAAMHVWVDTQLGDGDELELSRRMRVAASIIMLLHRKKVPSKVFVGDQAFSLGSDKISLASILDQLASVPLRGANCWQRPLSNENPCIWVSRSKSGQDASSSTVLEVCDPASLRRTNRGIHRWCLPTDIDLGPELQRLWQEIGNAESAA